MKCTICDHPEREEIDRALRDGAPVRTLAAEGWGSKSALHRHRTQCLVDAPDATEDLTQREVVAALRDHVKRARDAAKKATRDGQHQAAAVALKLEGEALSKLAALLPATASAGEEPTATAPRAAGISDETAFAIVTQVLGLTGEAAERFMSNAPAPTVAAFKPEAATPEPTAEQRTDAAVDRFEERMAEHEPPKAPPRRPVGTVRPFNDEPPTGCQCEPGDADQDCPVHGAARGGWGGVY